MTNQFTDILNRVNSDIIASPGIDLIEDGILDSLDVMNLVATLEQEYEIDFDPDDIDPDNFASAEKIWELLQKYLEEKANGAN
jgi:acyl carrier protein